MCHALALSKHFVGTMSIVTQLQQACLCLCCLPYVQLVENSAEQPVLHSGQHQLLPLEQGTSLYRQMHIKLFAHLLLGAFAAPPSCECRKAASI